MTGDVASLLVRITADGSQAVGVLNGLTATVGTLADKNAGLMTKISATGQLAGNVGMAITKTFGVATVAGLVASAKAAGQLNKELANIGTLSVPKEKLKQYKGDIQDIAIATGKSTSDISEGTYQVVSAFGDSADTMKKVEINAKAARAGLATTADSIALTSAVTKAYGDTSAESTQKVADLAFKTVELGQTTFPELAQNMGQVTSLSKELGISQEELFATYATLTGVVGNASDVQTQLKGVLNGLIKPSEKMQGVIHSLGYETGYSMVKTLGFAGTLDALQKATGNSSEKVLELFNNNRAISGILPLVGALYDNYTQKLGKLQNASGAATKAFEVQTEGVAKTGFTLEQAKIKMQVAAQKFGESAAPLIGDFADVVDRASSAIAGLDDNQRKAIINTGVGITKVGLGLAIGDKAVTLGTKIVTTTKAVTSALSAASGSAGLGGVAAAAGPAAIAIGAVVAAGVAGKVIYDQWYKSNYKFAEGLDEQAVKLTETRDKWKSLNDLRSEYKDLTSKINGKSLEGEGLKNAQARLDEIVNILKDEYKINVDSGDIDEAIKKAQELAETDALKQETALKKKLSDTKGAYDKAVQNLPQVTKEYNDAKAAAEKYASTQRTIAQYDNQFANGELGEESYLAKIKNTMADIYGQNSREYGSFVSNLNSLGDKTKAAAMATLVLDGAIRGLDVEGKGKKVDDLTKSIDDYNQAAEGLADINLSHFEEALKSGADGEKYLSRIAEYTKSGILNADEYARKVSLIKSGQETLNAVWAAGGDAVSAYVMDYQSKMVQFGASSEQVETGLKALSKQFTEFWHANGGDKNKHIEITADGKINYVVDSQEEPEPKDADVNYNKDKQEDPEPKNTVVNYDKGYQEPPENMSATVTYTVKGVSAFAPANKFNPGTLWNAKGNQNFPGGMAIVNDERGISDPRELIIDRGKAFLPEGRDVMLPLSRGAKIYTASQTKEIMRGLGIPRYAEGKNNSDAFTAARDDWQHYTRTHAVTTTQELEKWVELSKQFKDNEKDIWDIEEQIYSLTVKQTKELNEQSKAWLEERSALNDWIGIGDTPVAAFERIKERNMAEVNADRMTWEEYTKTMTDIGADMYKGRINQSRDWLAHEKNYNHMVAADYIAGLDRMIAYTDDYYARGIISAKEHSEQIVKINEQKVDKINEENARIYSAWEHDADAWYEMRTTYNDWDEVGDSEDAFWKRRIAGVKKMYEEGRIDYAQYIDNTNKYSMEQYKFRERQYDEMLQKQSKYIESVRSKYQEEQQALRDSWTVADRKEDMSEVQAQLDAYAGAVTDRGQQKYKELQDKMKQLQRDEQMYQLEQSNNATIKSLEAEYKKAEDSKGDILKSMRGTNINISGYVDSISDSVEKTGGTVVGLLTQMLTALNNANVGNTTNNTNYNDNSHKVTNNVYRIGEISHGAMDIISPMR